MLKQLGMVCLGLSVSLLSVLGQELKVASYNIRYAASGDRGDRSWEKRRAGVVDFLRAGEFDFVGLQEVLHRQLGDVEKGLRGMQRVGVGRDDGETRGEYSPIFYEASKWTLNRKEQGTFWLSDTPDLAGSKTWGNQTTRICTWARFEKKGGSGEGVYVFNTHWDHQHQESREKAAGLILERIKNREKKDAPVILMGDFNATTDNLAVKKLLESGELIDPAGAKQWATFNSWQAGLKEGKRIDHIFVTKGFQRAKVEIKADGDPVNSDHHPVVMEIQF